LQVRDHGLVNELSQHTGDVSRLARCDGKDDATGASPHDPYGLFCSQHFEVVNGKNESLYDVYNSDMKTCAAPGGAAGEYDCVKPSPMPEFAYEDNWVAQNAANLLAQKPAGAPWFLQVSFPGPHPPFVVTAPMKQSTANFSYPLAADNAVLGRGIQQEVRRDYAAELLNLDRNFGLVLASASGACDDAVKWMTMGADVSKNVFLRACAAHGTQPVCSWVAIKHPAVIAA
jgi:hypothetical protein